MIENEKKALTIHPTCRPATFPYRQTCNFEI